MYDGFGPPIPTSSFNFVVFILVSVVLRRGKLNSQFVVTETDFDFACGQAEIFKKWKRYVLEGAGPKCHMVAVSEIRNF